MLSNNQELIGRTLNQHYRIQEKISSGGFGCTYKAVDKYEQKIVVVKWLHKIDSRRAKELFQQEAKILKNLGDHPQIPTLIDYFEEDQQYYLVQEFIDGSTIENEVQAIARNKLIGI
ncbi:protein kinase domain-containing protein [Nostoc sp. CALU 546]|uniref:protein kinase domain-containing protein n=1 Tax=Nostoc sp. CALU 546 TaxID=1867241 RepID=UPI003B684F45